MNTLFILLNLGGKNNIEVVSFPTNPELSNNIGLSLGEGR
jgi:hypothetical protein